MVLEHSDVGLAEPVAVEPSVARVTVAVRVILAIPYHLLTTQGSFKSHTGWMSKEDPYGMSEAWPLQVSSTRQ